MAVIVGVGGLQNWPELVNAFTTFLESNDKNSLEGALDALYKVWSSCSAEPITLQASGCCAGLPQESSALHKVDLSLHRPCQGMFHVALKYEN